MVRQLLKKIQGPKLRSERSEAELADGPWSMAGRQATQKLDAETLWAERYDGDMSEIFEFQDAIRSQVVTALNYNLLGDTQAGPSRRGTISSTCSTPAKSGL